MEITHFYLDQSIAQLYAVDVSDPWEYALLPNGNIFTWSGYSLFVASIDDILREYARQIFAPKRLNFKACWTHRKTCFWTSRRLDLIELAYHRAKPTKLGRPYLFQKPKDYIFDFAGSSDLVATMSAWNMFHVVPLRKNLPHRFLPCVVTLRSLDGNLGSDSKDLSASSPEGSRTIENDRPRLFWLEMEYISASKTKSIQGDYSNFK